MMLASITLLISSALLTTATGNSMTGNFQSCSFQCSNDGTSGPPEPSHIPPSAKLLRGKSGPKGMKGENGHYGQKGDPGEDYDPATIKELKMKIRQLESDTSHIEQMEKKIQQLEANWDTIKKQRPQNCSEINERYPESTSGKYSIYNTILDHVGREVYCYMASEGVEVLPPKNCKEILDFDGSASDGVYTIYITPSTTTEVMCDMTGGGWTIFQKRFDGSENFRRTFNEYSEGFGDPSREHWLGLNNIHELTSQPGRWTLRVELQRFDGDTAYAQYEDFRVGAGTDYILSIGTHSGTAGDSMEYNSGSRFSTFDRDQDGRGSGNCASDSQKAHNGAWWWKSCGYSNLNGYTYGNNNIRWRTIMWYHWKNGASSKAPLEQTVMKIKQF